MRWGYFYLIMMFYCSCGLNKIRTEKSTRGYINRTDINFLEKKNLNIKSKEFVLYTDSSHNDYRIQFWPKGAFTFSAEKGFVGEADSVLIMGSIQKDLSYAKDAQFEGKDLGRIEGRLKQNEKLSANQQTKVKISVIPWKWLFTGLLLIGIAVWRYRN